MFYPANDNKPLFITVLHKKHPKSFVSNFWGAVQFETDSLIILATYTFAVYIVEVGLTIIYFRCSYLENLDKHWYSISSKLVWKTQIHVRYNIAIFKNLIIKVLEMLRNFRKPLTLYKCMKKWYISQAFSIFSTRYKKWSIHVFKKVLYTHLFADRQI